MIGGKLWCWLLRSHRWSKAYNGTPKDASSSIPYIKNCRRCGVIAPVKRRAKQEKGI